MMADKLHSEYCFESTYFRLPTPCLYHYEHHDGVASLLLVLPSNALSWTPSNGYHPKHLPSMHEQRREIAQRSKKSKKERGQKPKRKR
jgi:hypothetical protein